MSCKSGCDAPSKDITCAARMSDGRAFTDYRPRCAVNAELLSKVEKANMTRSAYESRMYLQSHSESLMTENYQWAVNNLIPCAPCARPFSDPGTMLPEQYVVRCDAVSCTRTPTNPDGLGDGRQYAF
jgi:hypothetical protein